MKRLFFLSIIALVCAAFPKADDEAPDAAEVLKDRLYTSIIQAYNVKNWEEVNALMEQLVAAGANIDELERTYAEALIGLDRENEAIERINAYLAKEPDDFRAYQLLGDAYRKGGDTDKAAEAYDKCNEMRPDFARPLVSKARMLAEIDKAAALDAYNKAIRIFLVAERPDAAIQIGVEAYKIDETNLDLLMQMADALKRANMQKEALSFYAAAIAANSEAEEPDVAVSIEAAYGMAMIYYRQKEYDKAISILEKMLVSEQIMGTDKDAYVTALCLAAACEQRLGHDKESQAYQSKAEGLEPEAAQSIYAGFLEL